MGRGENLLILTEFKTKFFITQNKEKKLHKKKKEQLNIISSVFNNFYLQNTLFLTSCH